MLFAILHDDGTLGPRAIVFPYSIDKNLDDARSRHVSRSSLDVSILSFDTLICLILNRACDNLKGNNSHFMLDNLLSTIFNNYMTNYCN